MEDNFFDKRKQDAAYLAYLIRHKAGIADAGIKLNLPASTIIKHDWSKFKPSIWSPHRDYFYSSDGIGGNNTRDVFMKYKDSRKEHFMFEPDHHSLSKDLNSELESVADWYAVYKAQETLRGFPPLTFRSWWLFNRKRVQHQLSPEAVQKVEDLLAQNIDIISYIKNAF